PAGRTSTSTSSATACNTTPTPSARMNASSKPPATTGTSSPAKRRCRERQARYAVGVNIDAAPSAETVTYPIDVLRDFSAKTFMHFGVPEADARTAADVLATSDLRGIDSHGVARLHTYFDMLSLGRINPTPNITIVRENATCATVDGDNGLGLVVGPK